MIPKQSAEYENMLNATRRSLDNARAINALVGRAQRAEDEVFRLERENANLRQFRDFVLWLANCAHADDCDSDPCSCLVDRARKLADGAGMLDQDGYAVPSPPISNGEPR